MFGKRGLFGSVVFAVGLWLVFVASAASAGTTITVNQALDVVADNGRCSLREAVTSANTNTASGVTSGECPAGMSGADTIVFGGAGTITLTGGQLDVTEGLIVDGGGVVTISAGNDSRIFEIVGAKVTLDGIVLRDGLAAGDGGAVLALAANVLVANSEILDSEATGSAGGIAARLSDLSITDSMIVGNTGLAGGVSIYEAPNPVLITDSVIDSNTGTGSGSDSVPVGGGLAIDGDANVTITRTAFTNNTITYSLSGAAIDFFGDASLNVIDSTISGNENTDDGHSGIRASGSPVLTVDGSTISGNTGSYPLDADEIVVVNSTVSNNTTETTQAAIRGDDVVVMYSTITGNSGDGIGVGTNGHLTIGGSIVANNIDADITVSFIGSVTSAGFNVFGTFEGNGPVLLGPGDVTGVADPGLGPLGNNGGPTQTHEVLAGSPAIDRVTSTLSVDPSVDQRGEVRPQGNAKDSGAYESALSAALLCNGQIVDVDFGAGDLPTAGDDVILGTSGDDVIVASTGNDTICGLGGDDTINTGSGDDWVDAGDGDDSVFGLDGNDTVFGGSGVDEIIGGNGDDILGGGPDGDTLNGGPGADTVDGGDGDDEIFGQGGDDILNGGDGADLIIGVDGVDEINGGDGSDTLNGGPDADTIHGDDGDDVIFGLAGDDELFGDSGNDLVFGQLGTDTINGGLGDDFSWGNEGDDTIDDPSGTNTINGGPGNDILTGGSGEDQIFGDGDVTQAGDDVIDGGYSLPVLGGSDTLIGFAGNDTITSTDGISDIVNGGPDSDNCTTDAIDTVFNCE